MTPIQEQIKKIEKNRESFVISSLCFEYHLDFTNQAIKDAILKAYHMGRMDQAARPQKKFENKGV